jgi:hypothetical protein
VRHQRPASELDRFVGKLRVYQVSWQDTGAVWLWNEFSNLFRIQCSLAMRGMYLDRTGSPGSEAWVNENVRHGHGALGAAYPKAGGTDGVKEGDTPSFLHLLAPGLSDPGRPEWGGWGGRFQRLDPSRPVYVDARDRHPVATPEDRNYRWTVGRWREDIARDLAARMDWCVRGFGEANHHPVVHLNGDQTRRVLHQVAMPGGQVKLDAKGTHDPDGDGLDYHWWQYAEAGTFQGTAMIQNPDTPEGTLVVPPGSKPGTLHVILQVTDRGNPPLTSYRRIIVEVR